MRQHWKHQLFNWMASRRHIVMYFSIISIGLITFSAFHYINKMEEQRLANRFKNQSNGIYNSLRENFNLHHEIVQSIRSFFRSGNDRSLLEFNTFVERDLVQYRGIQALEWIPRVPKDQRHEYEQKMQKSGYTSFRFKRWTSETSSNWIISDDHWAEEYFPVAFMQPHQGNEAAHGIDLASNPIRFAALITSRDTGNPVATAPVKLAQETGDQSGFLLFVPVYKTTSITVKERRQNLIGFALGVFRISDIVESTLKQRDLEGIQLKITDASSDNSDTVHNLFNNSGREIRLEPQCTANYTYTIGGRKWDFCFTPTNDYFSSSHSSFSYSILTLGSMLSMIIGVLVNMFLGRSQEVNTLVQQRTKELESAKNQLEAAHKDLRKKALLATSATRQKSEFLANMSHEIRTPMTAILGFTEVLIDEENQDLSSGNRIKSLRTIERNGLYLLDIINDILDISKIESGKLEIELILCSIPQLFRDISKLMQPRAKSKGLHISLRYEGELPEFIISDPTRLRQILINLIGNAIKFTEIGEIHVTARLLQSQETEARLQISVSDSGIGMHKDHLNKLFQPFVQADSTTTRKFGGTGLGLTISKRLCKMLGGDIFVKSNLGEGSVFTITIPVGPLDHCKEYEEESANTISLQSNIRKEKQSLNCHILLAEDGPDNQHFISYFLKKMGAEVTLADNGKIAFEIASERYKNGNSFDVILMDMQMPVLDGYSATTQLRKIGYTGAIIALTANALISDEKKCKDAGCDEFATKPINFEKLFSLIEDSIHRK
ncbi:MAG: hypothetical protein COA78_06155 [Blastopirellula sp.]|nr:MAG: hypothetical protein COA78_06155 [Blastopirellula sp.]